MSSEFFNLQLVPWVTEYYEKVCIKGDVPGFTTLEIKVLNNEYTATVTMVAPSDEHRADKIIRTNLLLQPVQYKQDGVKPSTCLDTVFIP